MGQDYAQRKLAKKKWKKAASKRSDEVSLTDKATRRDRKKRKTRRLCQGMCYKEPEIKPEDRKWNGKIEASDDDDEHMDGDEDVDVIDQERRAAHASATTSTPTEEEEETAPAMKTKQLSRRQKDQQRRDKAKAKADMANNAKDQPPPGMVRLSTGVHLLDPEIASQQATASARARTVAKAEAEGGQVVEATALAPYAPLIRSFMMSQGFAEPTPIQEACWPLACAGADVLGVAEPGSGKTLAYLLPLAVRLQGFGHSSATEPSAPVALVLAPTRELALQIAGACRLLRKLSGLRSVCLYGGVPKEQQVELLSKHPHIVVATPGRLLDLIDDNALQLHPPTPSTTPDTIPTIPSSDNIQMDGDEPGQKGAAVEPNNTSQGVQIVVLDEADKMLSLGFEAQLQRLHGMLLPVATPAVPAADVPAKKRKLSKSAATVAAAGAAAAAAVAQVAAEQAAAAPARPQVLLFTATMVEAVEAAAGRWLRPGAQRQVTTHSAASISKTVVQVVQVCAEHKKPAKLLRHLAAIKAKAATMRNVPRVLIFANRIKTVRFIHELVAKEGLRAVMLHGQRSQPEREEAMRDFRSGKAQVMVATDVAARGLDVRLLPYVVNYDFPSSVSTYIHRVGRTGRLAAFGHAYSFFTRNLARLAAPLVDLLQQHSQSLDPNLVQLAATWKEAEARLGPEGVAEAARRLAAAERRLQASGAEDGGEEEGEEDEGVDDEGDDVLAGAVEDHEADARLEVEDLMEGLGGLKGAEAGVSGKVVARGNAAGKPKKSGDEAVVDASQGLEVGRKGKRKAEGVVEVDGSVPSFQERLQKQKQAGVAVAQGKALEQAASGPSKAFVAAKKFSGPRPGYAFKLGPQGLGYYPDHPPKKLGKATLHQITAKGKGPIVPIGPQHGQKRLNNGSRFDSSSEDEEEEGQAGGAGGASGVGSAQGDGEESDEQPKVVASGGAAGGARQAKKPLGGRLRKKLAKERAAANKH